MKTNKMCMKGVLIAALIVLGAANVTAQVVPPDEDFEVTQNKDGKTLTISGYKGTAKDIIIPEKLYGLPVTIIGGSAFRRSGLTDVVIPEGVITIEDGYNWQGAFSLNYLTGVTIPDSVITIGKYAFTGAFTHLNGHSKLTSVTLGKSVTTIEDGAFGDNPLTSLILGRGLTSIRNRAFSGNQLTSITITKDVTYHNNDFAGISTQAGFEENFINFYTSQGRTPGTYVKNGPIWSKSSGNTAAKSVTQDFQPTHYCTENLRLRQSASTSAASITTLPQGTRVQVLQTGSSMTVDGITAPWVQVQTADGYTGWCFSGYLRK